ncbi:hypothetical protein [Gracilibacillus salinarum]|uniref:Uncharacterized protein n=1 Tax=Gracilibacillus salinarum TaxID=2932255 RepID=A0ABY4GGG0_9BACI|nr:hypothetical protein [Gracilibacillus salinarum]UOQ83408.1 hypothetical protein MUN87_11605 [Gracilibacillus salinarum]
MSIDKKLEDLFQVIVQEAKDNQAFAKKLEKLFPTKPAAKKRRKRAPALFNPVIVLEEGEDQLQTRLETLDIYQLKDIIAEYGMDPSKLVMRWRKKEKIIHHIVETTAQRAKKGDVFR